VTFFTRKRSPQGRRSSKPSRAPFILSPIKLQCVSQVLTTVCAIPLQKITWIYGQHGVWVFGDWFQVNRSLIHIKGKGSWKVLTGDKTRRTQPICPRSTCKNGWYR
jgi:hypothetical protein